MRKITGIIFCAFLLQHATPAHAIFAMAASMAYNALPFSPSFNFIAEAGQIIRNVQTSASKVKTTIYQAKSAYTSLKSAVTVTFANIESKAVLKDVAGNPGQIEGRFCGKKLTKIDVHKIAKKTREILLTYDSLLVNDKNETDELRKKFYMDNIYAINAAAGQLLIKLRDEVNPKIEMAKQCAEGNGAVCGIPETETGGNNEVLFTYGKTLEALDSVVKIWESVSALKARFTAVQAIKDLDPDVRTEGDSDGESQAWLLPQNAPTAIGKIHNKEQTAFAQVSYSQTDTSLSGMGGGDDEGDLVAQTIEFVSPEEPENEHNLVNEEKKLEALTSLEPAQEAVENALSIHNMIGEMKKYKESAEEYVRAQEEYRKYQEKLKLSESYGIKYVSNYFSTPKETWAAISSWAKDAYEVAKSAQAASSVSDDLGELSFDDKTQEELNDDPDGSKAEEKFKDVKIEKSKSDQEKSEEESRKMSLLAWQIGAEASKLLAEDASKWGTPTDKSLIWNDAKNFYDQYLTRKYDNIKKYLKSLNYNDVLAVVVERLQGRMQNPTDSKYQEILAQEGENAAQELTQYSENSKNALAGFEEQKKSAVAALEAERAQVVAKMDEINLKIKENRDEIADIKEVAKEKSFNGLEKALTAEVVFEEPGSSEKGKELGMDGMKSAFSERNEQATDNEKISLLEKEIEIAQNKLKTLEDQIDDIDDRIADARLDAQEGAVAAVSGREDLEARLLENIKKKQEAGLNVYAGDVKANMMAILNKLKESNELLNVPLLWKKSVDEAQGLVGNFEKQIDAIVDSSVAEMMALGDDLYKPDSHEKVIAIHNRMLDKIKALTGTYAVAGLIRIDNLAIYAKLLAADTSPETEGLFVGASPKARDLKAPYAVPNFILPPVREIVRFDETDFANVKPQQKKRRRKKNRMITINDFLNYGGEIPSVWKEMLKDNAFIESSYDLKKALSLGCEDTAFSRGGIMPCVVDGTSKILDVGKTGFYSIRRDVSSAGLPKCLKIKEVKGKLKHTLMDASVILLGSETEPVDCKYSELGMLFESGGSNKLTFRKRAFEAYETLNSDIDEDSSNREKDDMARAQQSSFDKNQIGDYLKHVENEKNYKDNLNSHKKTHEKQMETLKERLRQFGFEPAEDFDLVKESDYKLAVAKLKGFKQEEIKEAEGVLKIDVKDNEPVEEKVNLLKKLVSIMKEDDDGLLQLDLTSADDNDLAAQLKKAKTDSAVVDKYKNSLKEKQKSYNDTQEPFCANY